MGLTEDIQTMNKRITALEAKQEEVKRLLAVEEHKLKEIAAQLIEEGYDISKMTEAQIEALIEDLSERITTESDKLKSILDEAEAQFGRFQGEAK
jgi:hypothetical protein